jgi:ABC-2 type transport system ATP-binding protein
MTYDPAIELRGVHKRYAAVEALKGVDLAVREGEVIALLGPNGAGKTTCVNLMLGLSRPTAGAVLVFGMEPTATAARRRCGAMLQESGLPELLTVAELVRLFRSYYPTSLPQGRVIEMAGLGDCETRRFVDLSGGQRQRLYFGLAVCGDPELLFLDEPTTGLDVAGRRLFMDVVASLTAAGRTIVLTTHRLEEVDRLASRVVVLDRGTVVADESPDALRARVPGKRVRIRLRAPAPGEAFRSLPISSVRHDVGEVEFLTGDPAGVLQTLYGRQVAIADLEVAGADLEEAFVHLTGGR